MRLNVNTSLLIVVDVQEKIFATMHNQAKTERNINRIIEGAKVLSLPIIWTEQYPRGLGKTIASVRKSLDGNVTLEKIHFSCLGNKIIRAKVSESGKEQVLICGIEAHVCIYQTVMDLLSGGYDVHVVADAVMSRNESDYLLALKKMDKMGAQMTSVEMALFELQQLAKGDTFRKIARIIK